MSDHFARAQMVLLEARRLGREADRCTDPDQMAAIRAEMEVLVESMYEIRREQLREEFERPMRAPKPRRWWRRSK